jgi:hypothetical protein
MTERRKINAFFGFLAGIISALFGNKAKPTAENHKNADFPTSTQRMGVRFTDRIRDVFRFKWFKKP